MSHEQIERLEGLIIKLQERCDSMQSEINELERRAYYLELTVETLDARVSALE